MKLKTFFVVLGIISCTSLAGVIVYVHKTEGKSIEDLGQAVPIFFEGIGNDFHQTISKIQNFFDGFAWNDQDNPSNPETSRNKCFDENEVRRLSVKIEGFNTSGAGVLIAKDTLSESVHSYSVLVARHTVDMKPTPIEDGDKTFTPNYKVFVFDGESYKAYEIDNYDNQITHHETFDFALIEFKSSVDYPVATINPNADLESHRSGGIDTYIFGWKPCNRERTERENTSSALNTYMSRTEIRTDGRVTDYATSSLLISRKGLNREEFSEGHRVQVSNPAVADMSGSPIFDSNGYLIAILASSGNAHSNSRSAYDRVICPNIPFNYQPNWAIPISLIIESRFLERLNVNQDIGTQAEQTNQCSEIRQPDKPELPPLFRRPEAHRSQ